MREDAPRRPVGGESFLLDGTYAYGAFDTPVQLYSLLDSLAACKGRQESMRSYRQPICPEEKQ